MRGGTDEDVSSEGYEEVREVCLCLSLIYIGQFSGVGAGQGKLL